MSLEDADYDSHVVLDGKKKTNVRETDFTRMIEYSIWITSYSLLLKKKRVDKKKLLSNIIALQISVDRYSSKNLNIRLFIRLIDHLRQLAGDIVW